MKICNIKEITVLMNVIERFLKTKPEDLSQPDTALLDYINNKFEYIKKSGCELCQAATEHKMCEIGCNCDEEAKYRCN